jgi:hypothetical protein
MSLALALLERLDGERARRLAGHASFGGPEADFLFDNEVRLYSSLDELTETVHLLERSQPGRTAGELSDAVFAELAM